MLINFSNYYKKIKENKLSVVLVLFFLAMLFLTILSSCRQNTVESAKIKTVAEIQTIDKRQFDQFVLTSKDVSGNIQETSFVVVAGNNLNVRSKPNVSAEVNAVLPIADRLQIIFQKPHKEKINNFEGTWILATGDKARGWLFDFFMAYPSKFQTLYTPSAKQSTFINPQDKQTYTFTFQDTNFTLTPGPVQGKMYRFRDLIWAKPDNYYDTPQKELYFFYLDQKGHLKLEN
ncbi:hypothetical protein HOC37_01015 [bacterium]|nr:hypothetical protein [bacterium]MBT4551546.1 hypothetical protein [bacterium]